MRLITYHDVEATIADDARIQEALQLVQFDESMQIGDLLLDLDDTISTDRRERLKASIALFGAFCAGAITAKRILEQEQRARRALTEE